MMALILMLMLGVQDVAQTPEEAFRAFVLGTATKDEAALRAVTLPNDEFEWLLKGRKLPKEQVGAMKAQLEKMKIKSLKPGDKFTLPKGQEIQVRPDEVTDDRAVLLPEGAPIPTRCRKVDGAWKIDATPIIAGRKAAAAAQKAYEETKAGAVKKG